MEIRDPASIKKIAEARELIGVLQARLFKVEEELDNLHRAVTIALESGQYQLMLGFLQDAKECLQDRLTMPEVSEEDLNMPITIIHDDRKST
ncbi:MAG: hypothetical protein EBT86_11090 [Actinobacteria bacterium]|nr:hypothetical protein [Actinomycetota bacterium]